MLKKSMFNLEATSVDDYALLKQYHVFCVSTSFLIISFFVQRFFFRKDIISSKVLSWGLGRLLSTSLFKVLEKKSIFLKEENS